MLASALGIVIVSAVFGLLMLISLISMIVSLSKMDKSDTTLVKVGSVLQVDLSTISGDRTGTGLQMSFGNINTVGLIDACAAIRAAGTDENINAVYVTDQGVDALSWGSLTELRQALADFQASGKPVVSYATGYSQPGYYLCSTADIVTLHPSGMVDFRGMGAEVMYYKDLLDKLGVEMQLIRPESCAYKSAGEVYTLNHMSPANREQIRAYISSIWHTATAQIAASRNKDHFSHRDVTDFDGLTVADLNRIADNLSGYLASDARAEHLVDSLCFESDVRHMLREDFGGKQLIPVAKYAANVKKALPVHKDHIAVIYAEGNVVDGSARGFDQGVYGDDIVKALREAANDESVKAIVLRVNSPGGQATASEAMTYAVRQARAKKPVVVSMGDLAASAGYEMSCLADVIVAQPTTITGSIGVFGTVPNIGKMLSKKLGLNTDTVSTNRNASGLNIMRPLSPTAMAMMERNVEDFYKVFVGRVAEGRHMQYDDVHRIARGRVWTGADAIGIGLVDTLGGIDLAFSIAAEKAGVEKYSVVEFPKEKDTWTQLMELMGEESDSDLTLADKARLAVWYRTAKPTILSRTESDLRYVATAEGLQARIPFITVTM